MKNPRGELFVDWSFLLESCREAGIQEIKKEISKVLREAFDNGRVSSLGYQELEAKFLGNAEKIFDNVVKFQSDLALYGEAELLLV